MQMAKGLPKNSLRTVPYNRFAKTPGDNDAQSACGPTALNEMEGEQAAAPPPTLFQDVRKLMGSADSHLRLESLGYHRSSGRVKRYFSDFCRSDSRNKAFSAFCPPALQHTRAC